MPYKEDKDATPTFRIHAVHYREQRANAQNIVYQISINVWLVSIYQLNYYTYLR